MQFIHKITWIHLFFDEHAFNFFIKINFDIYFLAGDKVKNVRSNVNKSLKISDNSTFFFLITKQVVTP